MTRDDLISKATGSTDPQELREIEQCMRDLCGSTLDWQSPAEFRRLAKRAKKLRDQMVAEGIRILF